MTPADRVVDRLPADEPVLTGEEAEALRIVLVPSDADLARIERQPPRLRRTAQTGPMPEWQRALWSMC